jgi:tetratricopeptide (TPR) repeat protein/predicted Ser/Thr protein kinase
LPSSEPDSWFDGFRDAIREHRQQREEETPETPSPLAPPDFPRYEIRRPLGVGATSTVYQAWDRELDRPVALKVLTGPLREDSPIHQRFRREAKVLARLGHSNIVHIYDAGEIEGRMYVAMELIDGAPLNEHVRDAKASIKETVRLLQMVARGVHHAHERGIVHRDLKPTNILVTKEGEPKVVDFGLARMMLSDTELTRSGTTMGTPTCMSPEQVEGRVKEMTARTDVYALGAILFDLLTGRPPFLAETAMEMYQQIVQAEPPPPRRLNHRVPTDLEIICLKALEKEPARRYASAKDFADDLMRFLDGEAILAQAPSTWSIVRRRIVRHRWAVTTAMLVLAAVAVVGAILAQRRSEESARDRARPHVDAGNSILARLDLMLTQEDTPPGMILRQTEAAREEFGKALETYAAYPEAILGIARAYAMDGRPDRALEYCTKAVEASPEFATAYLERAYLLLEEYLWIRLNDMGQLRSEGEESLELRSRIEADLEKVRQWSKHKPELEFAAGILEFTAGKFRKAAKRLDAYCRTTQSDATGWFFMALAWQHAGGQKEQILQAATRALELRPGHLLALNLRGIAYFQMGDFDQAVANYDKAIRINPAFFQAYTNRGLVRYTLGDMDGALADYNEAIRLRPDRTSAFLNRGNVRMARGDTEGAMADFDRSISMFPRSADGYYNRANLRRDLGDHDGALRDYNEAIRLNPDYADAYTNRGNLHVLNGRLEEAIEDCARAIDLDPKQVNAYVNRGIARQRQGNAEKAMANFNAAIGLAPNSADARSRRGDLFLSLGDPEGAIEDYDRVLAIDPRHFSSWFNRGAARSQLGDLDGARKDLAEAIRIDPKHADAHYTYGVILQMKGDLSGAIESWSEAIRLKPDHLKALSNRGQAFHDMGEMDKAIADLTALVRLAPGDPMHYCKRAMVHRRNGDRESAAADFEKALSIAPPDWPLRGEAEELLRQLREE